MIEVNEVNEGRKAGERTMALAQQKGTHFRASFQNHDPDVI